MQQKLTVNQKQEQVFTQVQRQSLEILEMSNGQLEEYLIREQMENPVLSVESCAGSRISSRKNSDAFAETPENGISVWEESLEQFLWEQIEGEGYTGTERKHLRLLFSVIDEDTGYLSVPAEKLPGILQCSPEQVMRYRKILQTLETAGIGAEDLRESLIWQAERAGKLDQTLEQLIRFHLDQIARSAFGAVCRERGITRRELEEYLAVIRSLNPRLMQGILKKREEILLAVPDLRAWKDEEGWNIELCREERQAIQAESCYEELKKTTEDPLVKSYLKEKTERVRFLKTAVAKRRETLVQVTKFLLEKQEAWLEMGGEKETVTMEEAARQLGMSVSTVSRAVKEKYLELPGKLLALRSLFGEEGLTAVHQSIKNLIDSEKKEKPYSDAQIAALLGKEGISIARRTVAKYREQLNIASASERRSQG